MTSFAKKVRFAHKNSFQSPPTPALSFSSSISSDSEKIMTPPFPTHVLPGPNPYNFPTVAPYAPKYNVPIYPHPLLELSAITWNLLDPPSPIVSSRGRLSRRALSESATSPPMALLRIRSPHLPWIITVYASNGSFVTLEDLFHAVYNTLRRNITPNEFKALQSPKAQIRATRAYEARYREKKTATEYEGEKKGGMKRIDFLMGHTRFLGISNNSRRPDEWQLNVS